MPFIPGQLDQARRAMVDVRVAVPAARALSLQSAGLQVPGPLNLRAEIDTGAGTSCVDLNVCQALNLTPFGTATFLTPSTGANPLVARLYKVHLTVLHLTGNPVQHLVLPLLTVAQANLAPLGNEVLIGRDLLALCRFLYDGQAGTFRLDY